MDYKLTEEYRDRFAFNSGERYWIEEAFKLYVDQAAASVPENSIITAGYIKQLFQDINSKLDQWTE